MSTSDHLNYGCDAKYGIWQYLVYLVEMMNDHWNKTSINNGLHLNLISSGDVREEPHRLLHSRHHQCSSDASLVRRQMIITRMMSWVFDLSAYLSAVTAMYKLSPQETSKRNLWDCRNTTFRGRSEYASCQHTNSIKALTMQTIIKSVS